MEIWEEKVRMYVGASNKKIGNVFSETLSTFEAFSVCCVGIVRRIVRMRKGSERA